MLDKAAKDSFLYFTTQHFGKVYLIFIGNHRCPSSCPVGAQKYEEGTVISCGRFFLTYYFLLSFLYIRLIPKQVLITRLSQNCASMPKSCSRRSAVSDVIPRLPWVSSSIRGYDTASLAAGSACAMPRGFTLNDKGKKKTKKQRQKKDKRQKSLDKYYLFSYDPDHKTVLCQERIVKKISNEEMKQDEWGMYRIVL